LAQAVMLLNSVWEVPCSTLGQDTIFFSNQAKAGIVPFIGP